MFLFLLLAFSSFLSFWLFRYIKANTVNLLFNVFLFKSLINSRYGRPKLYKVHETLNID